MLTCLLDNIKTPFDELTSVSTTFISQINRFLSHLPSAISILLCMNCRFYKKFCFLYFIRNIVSILFKTTGMFRNKFANCILQLYFQRQSSENNLFILFSLHIERFILFIVLHVFAGYLILNVWNKILFPMSQVNKTIIIETSRKCTK